MGVQSRVRRTLTAEERELLDGLVHELGPRLLAYVRRVYGNEHEAEDIVAETFCRAASNVAALRRSDRRDLYLLTVARNLCRDRFRRRRTGPTPEERLREHAHPSAGPDDVTAADEQTQALRAAVVELPEGLREVVVLRLSSGLKFEQIAELLHIPLGTALSRMHAALQQLRLALGCVNGR